MDKQKIIEAIKKLANDGMIPADQRQADLLDIEFSAQEEREKLEARYFED